MALQPAESRPALPAGEIARGTITLIVGCMFSGKTTDLLRRLDEAGSKDALAVKHAADTRYSGRSIITHAGKAWPATIVAESAEIVSRVTRFTSLVAIDEAHFFDRGLPDVAARLASQGIDVCLTSLDPDSWGRPFANNDALIGLSDHVDRKTAVCARCGGVADRTQRLTPIVNGQMIVDPSSYEPRCSTCWRPPPEPPPTPR